MVGYRWYDDERIAPLFPFGHGLSYMRFEYPEPTVTTTATGFDVAFTIRNTGPVDGTETAQLYLSAPINPPNGIAFAPQSLVAFQRLSLRPNESRTVTVAVARPQMQYWSEQANSWQSAPGARTILAGASSRDILLSAALPPQN